MIQFILIESFLFYTISAGSIDQECKISTNNDNNYMCPGLSGVFDINAETLGCGSSVKFDGTDPAVTGISQTVISCDSVGTDYVIDCIVYASLGQVAGNCAQLDPLPNYAEPEGHKIPEWCTEENPLCCFGDDGNAVYVHEQIGNACIGRSNCEIKVNQAGFSILVEDGDYLFSEFDSTETGILMNTPPLSNGGWNLKVIYHCAAPVVFSVSCQTILELEGGAGSSQFVNNLEWIKVNDESLGDGGYYFYSGDYYMYYIASCIAGGRYYYLSVNMWVISGANDDLDVFSSCADAIGRCRQSEIKNCDGIWEFKASEGRTHFRNENVKILSMEEKC